MVLSIKDFEFIQLLCWCKNIPAPAETSPCNMISQKEINIFEYFDLICMSKDGMNIRPRPEAYRVLCDAGIDYKSYNKVQSRERLLMRRNISAQILYTFYRAGISVFNKQLDVVDKPIYLASFAARQKEQSNLFGSARFHGIFCTPQEAFLVFYIDDSGVHYRKEISLFNKLIEKTGITKRSIVIMGTSTLDIGVSVAGDKRAEFKQGKYIATSFAKVVKTSTTPVHFIPLGENGARMLRFLLIPNYREAIARTILQSQYKQPYEGFADTDAVHFDEPYNPVVIAFDMDINRIDRAIEKARSNDFEKIIIYALNEQMPFLRKYYGFTGKANLVPITISDNAKILNYDVGIYKPPISQYVSTEGRCFDVSDFDKYRQERQEGRTRTQ